MKQSFAPGLAAAAESAEVSTHEMKKAMERLAREMRWAAWESTLPEPPVPNEPVRIKRLGVDAA